MSDAYTKSDYFLKPHKWEAHEMGCTWFEKPYRKSCSCGSVIFGNGQVKSPDKNPDAGRKDSL